MKRILVTSALPYANGPMHIGQLAGCYLPADIYTRYQRLLGRDVIHICGTDEHGVPITLRAEEENVSPRDIVDRYYEDILTSLENFGIHYDNFSRTSIPLHHKTAQEFFLKVFEKGFLVPKNETQFFCTYDKRFLADRYIEGTCPYCNSEGARGDQCESCGKWLEPTKLIDPKCKICGRTPELRETKHWFFQLGKVQKKLEEWMGRKTAWKENVLRFSEGWFREGLTERAITRDIDWGVPVPLPEAKEKVIYVWFEAPIGYISSTIEWAEKKGDPEAWRPYWSDSDTKLVHFIGKDNIVFHAIVWPGMLLAHGDYILPSEIPANEFLTISGDKISTSRNWAVWLPEALKTFEPDILRYSLTINAPEKRDADFSWEDFQKRNNTELADILGNFVNRTFSFIHQHLDGKVPEPSSFTKEDQKLQKKLENLPKDIGDLLEKFEAKSALKTAMKIAKEANRHFDSREPWRTRKEDPDDCRTSLYVSLQVIDVLGKVLDPFLPFTAKKIRKSFGNDGTIDWQGDSRLEVGKKLGKPEILFPKIEDEVIKIQIDKLYGPNRVNNGEIQKTPIEEGNKMEEITIEEFKKIDLRVAEVIKAERAEGTKNLIRMDLKIGEEERQIVAGIAQWYSPEEIEGKKIIVVANLKPAVIRGFESKGMLLAAQDDSDLSIVILDKDLKSGAGVS
jgi:methionyl-tRNA synthetase